jgi:hypothetical protein
MIKKALLEFEGDTYWLDITDLSKAGVEILDNGKWRDVGKTEIDLFSLMETGKVIGDKKPE